MKRFGKALLGSALVLALCGSAHAREFLLGDETKGAKIKINDEADMTVRVRLQPRVDMGDLVKSEDGRSYESESDFYLRRIRLEIEGNLTANLKYNLTLEGDRANQIDRKNELKTQYAYLDYKVADPLAVRFGKAKLPYSRVSLTSSSKQLMVERPASTEAAKKLFDDYYQPNLLLHGSAGGGIVAYDLAVADGWDANSALYTKGADNTVHKAGLLYAGRVELSPPGWTEKSKSDSHLGKGQHLTLGADYAAQKGIEYKGSDNEEERTLWGVDLSAHWAGLSAQAEYNAWKIDSTTAARGVVKPRGWYAQVGYFIPAFALEPAARYEVFEQDAGKDETKQKSITAGLNWYLKGHGVKVQANWVRTKFDRNASGFLAGDDKQDVFQLQAQIHI